MIEAVADRVRAAPRRSAGLQAAVLDRINQLKQD
jgi:hypothetical protein